MRIKPVLITLVACTPTLLVSSGLPESPPAGARTTWSPRTGADRSSSAAKDLLKLINVERAAAGAPALAFRADLDSIARAFSSRLTREGRLRHNQEYLSPKSLQQLRARKLGENVAFGLTLQSVHRRLMESPLHRANILDRHFNSVGIGVFRADAGSLYVVEDFLAGAPTRTRRRGR